jgi:hypothetical protein
MRAHYSRVTLYAWVAAARARTPHGTADLASAGQLASEGKRPRDSDELMDDLFDYPRGAATLRHDQSRAATRTPANPTMSAASTSVMDESMRLAAATPAPAAERSPTGIGAEADRYAYEPDRLGVKALGEHPGMGLMS